MKRFEDYIKSADKIRELSDGFTPDVALILGSGLGFLAESAENAVSIPYDQIPGFAVSTAPGHSGRLVLGTLGRKKAALMQGRVHYYEGYGLAQIAFPVQVLRLLGAKALVITNAAGGLEPDFRPGDFMLISDHIKFFDESPLRGPNCAELGARFPDMSFAYSPRLRTLARETARSQGMELREGVYMYFPGPQYETPAEIRAARTLGASAVGMSTVPEVIAAAHAGFEVLGVSLITNMAAGILPQPLTEEEVLEAAQKSKDRFAGLITGILERLA